MAVIYAVLLEPRLRSSSLAKGVIYGSAVWIVNSLIVLPLIGQGMAGVYHLKAVGIVSFAIAHFAFLLTLSVLYAYLLRRSQRAYVNLPASRKRISMR